MKAIVTVILMCSTILSATFAIDFKACGEDNFYVEHVDMENCDDEVCYVSVSSLIAVNVTMKRVSPLTKMSMEAAVTFYGTRFPVSVSPEPCQQLICPLNSQLDEFTYIGQVDASSVLPGFTAYLELKSTSHNGDNSAVGFCIQIPIKLTY